MSGLRHRRTPIGATVALLAVLAGATPAHAECVQFDPWPSFHEAAQTAQRIIVGTVMEGYSYNSADYAMEFRLRVDEVLRGHSDPVIEFRGLVRSGAPLKYCSDSYLGVRVGDVIAMAFDARVPGVSTPVLAVAFLNRTPDQTVWPGIRRLSLREVRVLAAAPPGTDTALDVEPEGFSLPLLALVVAGLAGALIGLERPRRRRNRA